MRLPIILIALVSILSISGCSRNTEGSNYTHVEPDDAAMNAAIAKAKATSGDFVRAFHEQKEGTRDFFVKKPYATPSGNEEHMWIEVQSETNGILNGVVANDAEETKLVKMGQSVALNLSEISDWKYINGTKLVGGYTIRYFYDRMSPKEKEEFLKEAGFEM